MKNFLFLFLSLHNFDHPTSHDSSDFKLTSLDLNYLLEIIVNYYHMKYFPTNTAL
jgi:hypothetical protein